MSSAARMAPILSLPLLEPAARLATNLIPDPATPAPRSLLAQPGQPAHPSFLRRARPVTHAAHFSYLTPLPTEFPYDIPVSSPADSDISEDDRSRMRMVQMEEHIKQWEIEHEQASASASASATATAASTHSLRLFIPQGRTHAPPFAPFRLLGISPAALPQLDIGDTPDFILAHSGQPSTRQTVTSGPDVPVPDTADSPAYNRWALSEVLSGRGVAAHFSTSTENDEFEPVGVALLRKQAQAALARTQAAKGADTSGSAKAETELNDTLARLDALAQRKRKAAESNADIDIMPWAQAYAGHQFGEWAGQLGDGRATSLFEVALPTPISSTPAFPTHPQQPNRTDIQLKGAGRTPYSRFADGLATLQSSLREFLCAEYMGGGLGIESCRGLAVGVFTKPVAESSADGDAQDGVRVRRERWHPAAVMTRLAPSWVRVGSFELHASRGEWESVRVLGEYAVRHLFQWDTSSADGGSGSGSGEEGMDQPWALRLAREVAFRNATTIARWQVAGFMHGVMNTDNIALLGHTIDYGPYAFMDIFDEDCICNHSDSYGRYSYRNQPSMGLFALQHLVLALSPLIGFEKQHGRAAGPGELARLGAGELKTLSDLGEGEGKEVVKVLYMRTLRREWTLRWLARLGLLQGEEVERSEGEDEKTQHQLIDPLLVVLERLDFSIHLRRLADFPSFLAERGFHPSQPARSDTTPSMADAAKDFVGLWLDETHVRSFEREGKRLAAARWLEKYAAALLGQGRELGEVRRDMLLTNPRFVLRNWVTTEVADRVEKKNDTAFLERVLQMCLKPFHDWGSPDEGKSAEILAEENRLCSVGTPLEGHLPSCSS
ncbi:unnamed protein product [Tilletia laevis]|uniref:Selenoprotein O n=3 Tax=Tilletia TaxID=13289 RepID=A0A8X7T0E4_9BASI|nr:hypothetical protein CF336_g1142 [Tilletia laevis]KAE8253833.1 hypothetical protein A4X06_0g1193 [Tilletia controversa]KAE8264621.1 hypothetical protein A4X03_0g808 [Tilletia caries]CAD6893681.1 unnamed protein product [Tilletia caries]CAD6897031.1 unnamed protein product [Tilletia caries]